ncbi:MAG: spore coat protein YlbD [bacterium]|nr:spore coat protein YlbD [bacterium]
MSKIENFKSFVKKYPVLISYVNNNTMSWQKFYELYELYGEDTNIWNEYIIPKKTEDIPFEKKNSTMSDILNFAKQLDVDKVQNGISSLQKALELVGDLFVKKDNNTTSFEYEPRPLYKHFED